MDSELVLLNDEIAHLRAHLLLDSDAPSLVPSPHISGSNLATSYSGSDVRASLTASSHGSHDAHQHLVLSHPHPLTSDHKTLNGTSDRSNAHYGAVSSNESLQRGSESVFLSTVPINGLLAQEDGGKGKDVTKGASQDGRGFGNRDRGGDESQQSFRSLENVRRQPDVVAPLAKRSATQMRSSESEAQNSRLGAAQVKSDSAIVHDTQDCDDILSWFTRCLPPPISPTVPKWSGRLKIEQKPRSEVQVQTTATPVSNADKPDRVLPQTPPILTVRKDSDDEEVPLAALLSIKREKEKNSENLTEPVQKVSMDEGESPLPVIPQLSKPLPTVPNEVSFTPKPEEKQEADRGMEDRSIASGASAAVNVKPAPEPPPSNKPTSQESVLSGTRPLVSLRIPKRSDASKNPSNNALKPDQSKATHFSPPKQLPDVAPSVAATSASFFADGDKDGLSSSSKTSKRVSSVDAEQLSRPRIAKKPKTDAEAADVSIKRSRIPNPALPVSDVVKSENRIDIKTDQRNDTNAEKRNDIKAANRIDVKTDTATVDEAKVDVPTNTVKEPKLKPKDRADYNNNDKRKDQRRSRSPDVRRRARRRSRSSSKGELSDRGQDSRAGWNRRRDQTQASRDRGRRSSSDDDHSSSSRGYGRTGSSRSPRDRRYNNGRVRYRRRRSVSSSDSDSRSRERRRRQRSRYSRSRSTESRRSSRSRSWSTVGSRRSRRSPVKRTNANFRKSYSSSDASDRERGSRRATPGRNNFSPVPPATRADGNTGIADKSNGGIQSKDPVRSAAPAIEALGTAKDMKKAAPSPSPSSKSLIDRDRAVEVHDSNYRTTEETVTSSTTSGISRKVLNLQAYKSRRSQPDSGAPSPGDSSPNPSSQGQPRMDTPGSTGSVSGPAPPKATPNRGNPMKWATDAAVGHKHDGDDLVKIMKDDPMGLKYQALHYLVAATYYLETDRAQDVSRLDGFLQHCHQVLTKVDVALASILCKIESIYYGELISRQTRAAQFKAQQPLDVTTPVGQSVDLESYNKLKTNLMSFRVEHTELLNSILRGVSMLQKRWAEGESYSVDLPTTFPLAFAGRIHGPGADTAPPQPLTLTPRTSLSVACQVARSCIAEYVKQHELAKWKWRIV
ncbi:hypothetical protein M427DRAFT_133387 [Gonapodya prolifera JEL478]|uniref:Uncharacterized protein n=1 Tax=Gonapodya prolifera (strain JEL478) TaxID=1344416 RepID=A0A139ALC0_GONPJ|nr:hypothetical protein M427DRAFT_133387 [Gonapodya prolifera JEL478]|eukprot:KXS17581.1 hypothetical protein M427DRAFT_133387 [Gonapodya prolifera JEL478]